MIESQLDQLLAQQHQTQQDIVDVDEPVIKLVIFSLAGHYFAFPGTAIKEVLQGAETVFFVPGMPASVEGVINVRGDIESVISLHELLHLNAAANKINCIASSILLGKSSSMHSGLRVDQLLDVVDFPESQLQTPPSSLPEYLQPFVTNLLVFNGLPVTLLDINAVFTSWLNS